MTSARHLAASATVTVTYSVTVNNPDTGDRVLSSAVTSPTLGTTCPVGGSDPACSNVVTVSSLTLSVAADVTATEPTGIVRTTYTAVNTGQTPYTGISIAMPLTDVVDDATYRGDAQASSGTLQASPLSLTWTGNLAPGASVTITASVTVNNPDTGNKVLRAFISSTAEGSTCQPGSTTPPCASVVPVLTPGLTITKTASAAAVAPGDPISYTITVANTGETAYTGVTVTDPLSAVLLQATYNNDATASTGTVGYAGSTITWTGDLAAGATATITFSVTTLNPNPGDRFIINQASSPAIGSNCPPGSSNPACVAAVEILVPQLTIQKTADVTTTAPGGVTTYTITVSNTGPVPYIGASFSDPLTGVLDDAAYNGDVTATAGTAGYTAPTLGWTGNLAPGASATITYSVTTNSPAAGDGVLANTITSTTPGSNCASGSPDTRCAVSLPVAQLTLEVSFSSPTASPGDTLQTNYTYTNTGQTPYTGINITFVPTADADYILAAGDRTTSSGTSSVDGNGGQWTGDIPVGGTVTGTATVTLRPNAPSGALTAGRMETSAVGSNCPPGNTDPRCAASVTVLVPGLTVTTAADTTAALPGGTLTYTTTVTNSGQTTYTGVAVASALTGLLDDAVYNGDAAATTGSVSYSAPTLTWTGTLAPGASATVTFTATVRDPDPGDKAVTVRSTSSAAGSSCPPGNAVAGCGATVLVLTPGLTIQQSADAATALPGQTVTWTISVANTGQSSYPAATVSESLAGILDDAAYNNDAAATTGSVSYSAPTLTWTGALAPGASATITFTTTVDNPVPGDQSLTGTVVSNDAGSTCPAGGGNQLCATTVPVTAPALLTFTKSADVASTVAGGTVTYTITVANAGATPYLDAELTDDLTAVLDDAAYNGDATTTAGTLDYTGPTLSWEGDVPGTGTVTITYSVTVDSPVLGNHILTDTVVSSSPGSNCTPASTDPRCVNTVTVSELTIQGSSDVPYSVPGGAIRFTATYTNTGQTPYNNITIRTSAADLSDDFVGIGDQTASSGVISIDELTFESVWTGSIPVGGTVTLTGSGTVLDPDPGNRDIVTVVHTTAPGSNCPVGNPAPACRVSVPVLLPGLTMTTAADVPTAVPGGVVNYTVTITNSGETPYTGAAVANNLTGALDDAVYGGDATASTGSVAFAGQTLTWTGDLGVGQVATVTYSLTVRNPDPGDKVMRNILSSTVQGSACPPNSGNTGCAGSVAVLTPALTIAKSASTATALPGEAVTFTIAVSNTGQVPFPGATVVDALGGVLDDATYNGDAGTTAGTVDVTGSTLTWTGDLNPGGSATVTYSVTLLGNGLGSGDGILANSATSTVAGNNCPTGGTDPRCSATVRRSELNISFTGNRSTAGPGEVISRIATITNTGQVPYTGATVYLSNDDTQNLLSYNGDASTTTGSIQFDLVNLRIVWTGDLAPGQAATITASSTVRPVTQGGEVTSVAESPTPGSNCPIGGSDPACSNLLTVLKPQLTIVKTPSTTTTVPGGTITWTVTISNTGETAYTGATVTDDLTGLAQDTDYNGDATATTGALGYSAPLLTWTGDLAVGASATITFTTTVHQQIQGPHALFNTVRSAELGSTCPPSGGNAPGPCRALVLILIPQLTITKTAATGSPAGTAVAGSPIDYTVTVANTGETPYTGASFTDDLTDVLDDAAYNGDAAATTGTVDFTDPELTWTGDLAIGATATITYSVTTALPANGNHTATNAVSSATPGTNCLAGGTDTACTTTTTVLVPALSITKAVDQASIVTGGTVHYTITATNTGESPYSGITITDTLDDLAGNATWVGDAAATTGTVDFTDPVLTWTGDLAIDASVTITYSVAVDDAATPGAVLANRVVSPAPGSTCTGLGTEPACETSTTIDAQTLTLTNLTDSFTFSGQPQDALTLHNAVTMTVITNSADGYTVSVQGTGPTLTAQNPANDDTIPLDALSVRGTGQAGFQPLSETTPALAHSQDAPSAPGGDAISNDFSVDIPFVASDTYSTTLDYIAATK